MSDINILKFMSFVDLESNIYRNQCMDLSGVDAGREKESYAQCKRTKHIVTCQVELMHSDRKFNALSSVEQNRVKRIFLPLP